MCMILGELVSSASDLAKAAYLLDTNEGAGVGIHQGPHDEVEHG